ncbi:MAG: tripartite tricarboxylate transporter substrate binding protein BugD [Bradyrhizobiaceae bacterium]|nr:tripartite tricarboxylate transporter substrate binding protein BugD [Bradyrhizobiaceae bacterium]
MTRFIAAASLVLAAVVGAEAQDYPRRSITVVAPFAAGGPADITARVVADILSRHLGQNAVVENVGGAGGTIGAQRVARANPDGHTLLSGHLGTNAVAPMFYPSPGYDPQKDFEPISLTAEYPEVLVTRKDFPASDFKAFVAYAKANEDRLNMGHAGVGSVSYIGCLLLSAAMGVKPTMVPFTGTAPMVNAIVAGQIDYGCDPVLGPIGQIRAGNVKALAVAAKARSPLLPDVPTSHEQGMPAFDCAPFYGMFAPKGTPRAVIDKIAAAISDGLSEEAVERRMAELGASVPQPARRGPEPLAGVVASEIARFAPIIKNAVK